MLEEDGVEFEVGVAWVVVLGDVFVVDSVVLKVENTEDVMELEVERVEDIVEASVVVVG